MVRFVQCINISSAFMLRDALRFFISEGFSDRLLYFLSRSLAVVTIKFVLEILGNFVGAKSLEVRTPF